MKELITRLLNYFLIGILAVIPIVVILQIMIFVKDRVSDLFQMVYGYADNYLYTILVFAVSFFILVYIGRKLVQEGRSWVIGAFDHVIDESH